MNFFELSLAAGTVVLLIFAIQLFLYTSGNLLLNKLLGIFFIIRVIIYIFILSISLNSANYSNVLFIPVSTLAILGGPVIYLYIRSFINDESKLHRKDLWHLIPFSLACINILPLLVALFTGKAELINNDFLEVEIRSRHLVTIIPINTVIFLRSAIEIVYLIFSWRLLIRFLSNKSNKIYSTGRYHLEIFLGILTIQFFFAIIYTFNLARTHSPLESLVRNGPYSIILSSGIFIFIIWMFRHPVILYGNLILKPKSSDNTSNFNDLSQTLPHPSKVLDNTFDPSTQLKFVQQAKIMEDLMVEKKPFLNPEFSLADLADMMNVPAHHCSFLVNQVIDKSFREYVNGYRISHFIDTYNRRPGVFTIEVLAMDSGYQYRSTFNKAFKNETGKTPSEYFNLPPDS